MLGNKEIMAQNIKLQMAQNNVNATELCKALGIKQNTFSDWVNAKTYPRIDKIELMANYFGISKADLVESKVREFILSDKEKAIIELYRKADVQRLSGKFESMTQKYAPTHRFDTSG